MEDFWVLVLLYKIWGLIRPGAPPATTLKYTSAETLSGELVAEHDHQLDYERARKQRTKYCVCGGFTFMLFCTIYTFGIFTNPWLMYSIQTTLAIVAIQQIFMYDKYRSECNARALQALADVKIKQLGLFANGATTDSDDSDDVDKQEKPWGLLHKETQSDIPLE